MSSYYRDQNVRLSERYECEECVKIGASWVHLPLVRNAPPIVEYQAARESFGSSTHLAAAYGVASASNKSAARKILLLPSAQELFRVDFRDQREPARCRSGAGEKADYLGLCPKSVLAWNSPEDVPAEFCLSRSERSALAALSSHRTRFECDRWRRFGSLRGGGLDSTGGAAPRGLARVAQPAEAESADPDAGSQGAKLAALQCAGEGTIAASGRGSGTGCCDFAERAGAAGILPEPGCKRGAFFA